MVAAAPAVVANSAKLTFDQLAAVTVNNGKVSYVAAAAQVAANVSAIATKAPSASPSFTGVVQFPSNTIDNTTTDRWKNNAQFSS